MEKVRTTRVRPDNYVVWLTRGEKLAYGAEFADVTLDTANAAYDGKIFEPSPGPLLDLESLETPLGAQNWVSKNLIAPLCKIGFSLAQIADIMRELWDTPEDVVLYVVERSMNDAECEELKQWWANSSPSWFALGNTRAKEWLLDNHLERIAKYRKAIKLESETSSCESFYYAVANDVRDCEQALNDIFDAYIQGRQSTLSVNT